MGLKSFCVVAVTFAAIALAQARAGFMTDIAL